MKKYSMTIITAALLCGLCSCGDKTSDTDSIAPTTAASTTSATTTEEATTAAATTAAAATTTAAASVGAPIELDYTPEGADLTAFHTDEYGAVVFDKPVEEQSEATLKAAAKTLWANAARIAWACKLYETTLDDGCTLPDDVDGERFIEANDSIYALVKDENVKSIDDVIAGYHRLFSDKYPYDFRLDDEFYYTEYNGRMYFSVYAGQRGSNIDYDDSEIASYDGRDGNEMHFTVHDNYDATKLGGEAYTKNNEFTMVLGDDGTWRIGKFTLPY